MTGSQTDKVTTPIWAQASVALQQVGRVLFYRAKFHKESVTHNQPAFLAWWDLRRAAAQILEQRAIAFSPAAWQGLIEAFRLAHAIEHDMRWPIDRSQADSLIRCDCKLSQMIDDAQFLLVTNNSEVIHASEVSHAA